MCCWIEPPVKRRLRFNPKKHSATKRLDGKQNEKYGGQPVYDAWRARTGGLFPKFFAGGDAGRVFYDV